MDLPTFLNEGVKNLIALLGVIAWPATVLIVVWLFRLEIKAKIQSLAVWEGWGVNAQFNGLLKQIEISAEEAELRNGPSDVPGRPVTHETRDELSHWQGPSGHPMEFSAASRIVQTAFSDLVQELRKKAGDWGYTPDGKKKRLLENVVSDMIKHSDMPEALGQMILELRKLRNIAISEPSSVTAAEALRYIKLADDAKRGISNLPSPT